jgi:hypothetical protein
LILASYSSTPVRATTLRFHGIIFHFHIVTGEDTGDGVRCVWRRIEGRKEGRSKVGRNGQR